MSLAAALALAGTGGCAAFKSPAGAYVGADRAAYQAVAPAYETYVTNDPSLDAEQRDRRLRTVQSWRLQIESAEQQAAAATE